MQYPSFNELVNGMGFGLAYPCEEGFERILCSINCCNSKFGAPYILL